MAAAVKLCLAKLAPRQVSAEWREQDTPQQGKGRGVAAFAGRGEGTQGVVQADKGTHQ